jgi:transaldolase
LKIYKSYDDSMNKSDGYFQRVTSLTPTRLWINNPTVEEAQKSIEAGAVSCTTNPTYAMKMIQSGTDGESALQIVEQALGAVGNDGQAADFVQQRLVKRILDIFLPLYEKEPGRCGFVSIQGDPSQDTDPKHIIDEALRYKRLGNNFITKIPVTDAGLKALEALIQEDMPMIATEIMGISQAVETCEMYQRVSEACGKKPPLYLTHITGIFDEYLTGVVERGGIRISRDILWQAGTIIARKQYRLLKERNYPGIMLGGGARGLHHFTEMVGAEMHITINWKGTADRLIEQDPPVVHRFDTPAPQYVVDELLEKIPDFRRAYREDGLNREEFADFGPVVLFRSMFLKGWDYLLTTIKQRRFQT